MPQISERLHSLILESATWTAAYRRSICQGAYEKIIEELSVNDSEAIANFVVGLLKVAISADRSLTQEEYDLFCDVTGNYVDPDEFYEITNGGSDPRVIKAVDEEVDHFTDEAKFACCTFVLCFVSSDGKITKDEEKLMIRLFE